MDSIRALDALLHRESLRHPKASVPLKLCGGGDGLIPAGPANRYSQRRMKEAFRRRSPAISGHPGKAFAEPSSDFTRQG